MAKKVLKNILAAAIALPFCMCAFTACGEEENFDIVNVYMPDGAPALALAGLMAGDTDADRLEYCVVNPIKIQSMVTGENADVCILPLSAATKFLGDGETYQMLGTVTHGNLYLISRADTTIYDAENLGGLIGKKVGVLQLASTPGLAVKTALTRCGVPFAENGVAADKVNLVSMSGEADIALLEEGGVEHFIMAEPEVTALKRQGFSVIGNVQELYGENGYPQAVMVAKRALIEEDEVFVRAFMQNVQTSVEWAKTASGADIVAAVTAHLENENYATKLDATSLLRGVVARCGVRFENAAESKADVLEFLQAAGELNPNLATLPQDGFFFE